tara:strand:- start:221 stop:718 length:498 start_codon:yes stop_codon:yes gene_type:complete
MHKQNFYIHAILSLISIVILVNIYVYLDNLKDCSCFMQDQQSQDKDKQIDIEFLKFYQILELLSYVIFTVFVFLYSKNKMYGGKKSGLKLFLILSTMLLMFITFYVSYNSFLFYVNANHNCKCVNKWQKYFIYLQGVFNGISSLRLFHMLLMSFVFMNAFYSLSK